MKKIVFLFLFTVPLLVFLNVWQTFRFMQIKNEVVFLGNEQREWLERNKRMIAGIAVLDSPARLDQLAGQYLGLIRKKPGEMFKIQITP
ncbi:MAG: cell division protein FtsL [Spirochaetota bacterium]